MGGCPLSRWERDLRRGLAPPRKIFQFSERKWRILVHSGALFGRPFVKRFALCYQAVVCPACQSCLSVTSVYCDQTVGSIKIKLGMQLGLGPGRTALDGDPASIPHRDTSAKFSVHICCRQIAGWIKMPLSSLIYPFCAEKGHLTPTNQMPLGIKVCLSSGDFVLMGT